MIKTGETSLIREDIKLVTSTNSSSAEGSLVFIVRLSNESDWSGGKLSVIYTF